ncbi:MAG: hypothetical protein AB9846_02710 [Tenuifilaceae bacterium]
MRVAIVDMGTNTFNLLIVEASGNNNYQILHNSKFAVKLGEGGIDKKVITPEAWNRGLVAIDSHMATISTFNVDKIIAFATSATRDAENGSAFIEDIYKKYNLKVDIIDGDQEALLIYQGVRQVVALGNEINLILDIGGGSNEFVICNSKQVFWMHSFNLGVQRLLQQFKPSDPVTANELKEVESYLDKNLNPIYEASTKYLPKRMVGSSGSFDTFRSLLAHSGAIPFTSNKSENIPLNDYYILHQKLLESTKEERIAMPGMEPIRVDYIVLSSIFTNLIIKRLGITSIIQSDFALKEGALWELLNKS